MHTLHVFKWIDSFRLYNSIMDLNKIGVILLTILRESFTNDQKASPTTFRNPSASRSMIRKSGSLSLSLFIVTRPEAPRKRKEVKKHSIV